ncbi:MAG: response regulator [Nitrospirae bacterium]|nr:response regulator [Nitrospirota bacterium]
MEKSKVLVIDDDENNRIICKANLSQIGVTVIEAKDGQEGFEAALREMPDLILLDIMMPEMDGYETLEKLKDNLETRDIPVIMLTAKTDSMATEIAKALLAGAADYIRKPYQLAELIARVRNLARKHLLEKERAADLRDSARFQSRYLTNSENAGRILKSAKLTAVFFNKPAADISGDFWFFKDMPKGKAGLLVADTCGHGVLAALMSIQILSVIDNCPAPILHPSECLMSINTDIYGLLSPEHSFIAAMYFVFDQNKL